MVRAGDDIKLVRRVTTKPSEIGTRLTFGAGPMFRFDLLIRSGMTVREVKQRYPSTAPLFDQFGFRSVCDWGFRPS
jgi:hypothetical protein